MVTKRKEAAQIADRKKKKRHNIITTAIFLIVLLAGVCVLMYPAFADWWNGRIMARAVAAYDGAVSRLDEKDFSELFAAADDYNDEIFRLGSAVALADPDRVSGYDELLDITGTGMMGYVTIDRIDVKLPIYHGTDADVLAAGAGHLKGSSLPTGGADTHGVISAHRGLPSARLFSDLDSIREGDTFTVTVLDRVLTYEVDRITVVLPTELEELYIVPGADTCTLMTCTPYGVNTHRLLVRGRRIETPEERTRTEAEARKINILLVALFLAAPLLILMAVIVLIDMRRHRLK